MTGKMPGCSYRIGISWLLSLVCLQPVLSGCASPSAGFDRQAGGLGFQRREVVGDGYTHAVFLRPDADRKGPVLHLYLDGDGRPWMGRYAPARDPTPRRTPVLDLMALDPAPSVLLGRPCYHGFSRASRCERSLWTSGRYSPAIVASMVKATRRLNPRLRPLVLIGHSGGGTLAMLMAPELPEVVAVITLAANLDVDSWTRFRGVSRLAGSMNPVRDAAGWCPACIRFHFAGDLDRRIPPHLIDEALRTMREPGVRTLSQVSHVRGWDRYWVEILSSLNRALRQGLDAPQEPLSKPAVP